MLRRLANGFSALPDERSSSLSGVEAGISAVHQPDFHQRRERRECQQDASRTFRRTSRRRGTECSRVLHSQDLCGTQPQAMAVAVAVAVAVAHSHQTHNSKRMSTSPNVLIRHNQCHDRFSRLKDLISAFLNDQHPPEAQQTEK